MAIKATCRWLMASLFAGACVSVSWAGDNHHRSHDAHVHGLAELTVALEGGELAIQLESPAVNIVGFEHRAVTAEQRHVIEQAEATLKSANNLFAFAGTNCDVKEVMVDMSAVEGKNSGHHDHHNNKHRHHDKGEHKHHDEHEHAAKHHGNEHHDSHSEISAEYMFICDQKTKLTSITLTLLDLFPGIESLNVMWITDAGQGAMELNQASKDIRFTR